MKVYTVHTRENASTTAENTAFVPESFSLIAIIFPLNFIWAISNRMWLFLAVILLYFLSSFSFSHLPHNLVINIIMVKLALFPFLGIWANDFRRFSLKHRGFKLESIVSGKNESEAQLRYFESLSSRQPALENPAALIVT